MSKIGFIGVGNMGYAMLKGVVSHFNLEDIVITSHSKEKYERIAKEVNVSCVDSNAELAKTAKYVILAVKPVIYNAVIEEIKDYVSSETVIISIAPGISIDSLKKSFGNKVKVVRAMPNTPAMVGEGMTGVSLGKDEFSKEELEVIDKFFNSFGKVSYVEERLMDAIVCGSGSSPAYVYMFIEALADSIVKYGIKRDDAIKIVAQTVLGSAKMVLETNTHPAILKDNVCSPGGTTIYGVTALEEYGLRNAIIKATDACYDKCTKIK